MNPKQLDKMANGSGNEGSKVRDNSGLVECPIVSTQKAPMSKPRFLPYLTKKQSPPQKKILHQPPRTSELFKPLGIMNPNIKKSNNAPQEPSGKTPPILLLPLEIWDLITSHAPQSSIAALVATRSSLHDILTPFLYRVINLSISTPAPLTNCQFSSGPLIKAVNSKAHNSHLAKSQYLFIQQILSHPELAVYVRVLGFTLGLERMGLLPELVRGLKVAWKDEDLFSVFGMLTNVVEVNLGTGTSSFGDLREGKALFPRARNVKLSGIMRSRFVGAVLVGQQHGNGKWKGFEDEVAELKILTLDDLTTAAPHITNPNGGTRRAYHDHLTMTMGPPMQHILMPALYDRCRNLQRLSIRAYRMSERGTVDDELWAEWATFMKHVQPKEVVFDCDRRIKRWGQGIGEGMTLAEERERYQRQRVRVVIDRRFSETLLPVLREGWDGLKRVEVRGVGEDLAKELQGLGEKGVEVIPDTRITGRINTVQITVLEHGGEGHWAFMEE